MEALQLSLGIIALFLVGGFIAGFIDSIAGGGGLITLPLLSIVLGAGVVPIASNKIVGVVGALAALIIYARQGHLDWRRGTGFVVSISVGSFLGSILSPLVPASAIRWFLIAACPILLYIVWRKNHWVDLAKSFQGPRHKAKLFDKRTVLSGLACGLYDGAFGPGGGTFMFLSLIYFVKLPLFAALAISKLANTASAATALVTYAGQGYVHWSVGSLLALGMLAGALTGSSLNLKKADIILRPVLGIAVLLLLLRLLKDSL